MSEGAVLGMLSVSSASMASSSRKRTVFNHTIYTFESKDSRIVESKIIAKINNGFVDENRIMRKIERSFNFELFMGAWFGIGFMFGMIWFMLNVQVGSSPDFFNMSFWAFAIVGTLIAVVIARVYKDENVYTGITTRTSGNLYYVDFNNGEISVLDMVTIVDSLPNPLQTNAMITES